MNNKIFLFSKNGCKVSKLIVMGKTYFVLEKAGTRYVRYSLNSIRSLMNQLEQP